MLGKTKGNVIFVVILKSPAPDILADSSRVGSILSSALVTCRNTKGNKYILSIAIIPPIVIISIGDEDKLNIFTNSLFIYPAFGDNNIFQAKAPIKEGSIKGTKNIIFMNFLNGKSVLATSQAKNTPNKVEINVVPIAIIREFKSAEYVSLSDNTFITPATFNFPFSKKAVNNINKTGTATIITNISIDKIKTNCATLIFFKKSIIFFIRKSPFQFHHRFRKKLYR